MGSGLAVPDTRSGRLPRVGGSLTGGDFLPMVKFIGQHVACARRGLAAIGALLLIGCGSEQPPALTVGRVSFTEDQLLGLTRDRRRSLAHLTGFGLAVADSTTALLGEPLIATWVDDRKLEILAAELTLEKNGIGDAVLEAQYLMAPDWELTVRHILFFSERWRSATHRTEAETKAKRAMESLRAGADFATTAAELSEEPGAEGRQGRLTPGREGSWVPEFWAAALALQPGEISPVTETQYGYHILRLESRRVVPFAEARSVVARTVAKRIEDPGAVLDAWMVVAAAALEGEESGALEAEGSSQSEAGRTAALAEAAARRVEVPDGERASLRRIWDDETYRWAATLGFEYGSTAEQVAVAAMTALSNSSQGANLVRREVAEHAALIEVLYPGAGTPPPVQP
jgi:PPIC-type peptidyl-prolyl cis-trans isomerase-like protein